MRKRERQKKLGRGVFLLYNYKCIGRKYMYIQTETQFIHFAYVCISEKGEGGERDLGEWRARSGRWERGEQKYMYLYNFFCFIQLETIFLHLCLYKKWGTSERLEESGERDIWERDAWQFFANVCYGSQLSQTLTTPFILGY